MNGQPHLIELAEDEPRLGRVRGRAKVRVRARARVRVGVGVGVRVRLRLRVGVGVQSTNHADSTAATSRYQLTGLLAD
jgi:hypothetical protein